MKRHVVGHGATALASLASAGLQTLFNFAHHRAYTLAMPRELVWIENPNFQGFGCSGCNWVFNASGALVGDSLDEMKQKYEAQRDKEFAAHLCADLPKATRK